jgi:hypothetical protein
LGLTAIYKPRGVRLSVGLRRIHTEANFARAPVVVRLAGPKIEKEEIAFGRAKYGPILRKCCGIETSKFISCLIFGCKPSESTIFRNRSVFRGRVFCHLTCCGMQSEFRYETPRADEPTKVQGLSTSESTFPAVEEPRKDYN